VDQRKICVNPYCPGTGDYHFPVLMEWLLDLKLGTTVLLLEKKYSVSSAGLHV
jgi:hypothetical protein